MQANTQKLSDDSDDEDEEEDAKQPTQRESSVSQGVTFGGNPNASVSGAPPAAAMAAKAGPGAASVGQSFMSKMSFAFSQRSNANSMANGTSFFLGAGSAALARRRIVPSVWGNLWFVSPFLLWLVVICAIDAAAYMALSRVGGDVATYNIINFLVVRCAHGRRSTAQILAASTATPQHTWSPCITKRSPVRLTAAGTSATRTTCRSWLWHPLLHPRRRSATAWSSAGSGGSGAARCTAAAQSQTIKVRGEDGSSEAVL